MPTRFLLSADDRFFPAGFMGVAECLGLRPDELSGDHCPMLGHPKEVAEHREACRTAL
ncbi:hypothetical protein [Kitasatospora sp. NPDC087315]|uniref:hypothetical protein n=1 Tax=Kitasatospora sp. NPDC087315 TaxID=3364069 RepID=UPI0038250840